MSENTPGRTFLIVLGMHRSGTSALTGTLGILGARLPDDLVGSHPFNEKGHFESKSLKWTNEEMLRAIGTAWYDLRGISPSCFETVIVAQSKAKMKETIQEQYGDASLLVLKDPRFCRSFPVIRSILDEYNASPLVIFCFRNPIEVAHSLKARDQIPLQHGIGLWLRYMLDGEFHSRGLQRVFVDFADFLRDWRITIKRIEQGLGISLPASEITANEVEKFIDSSLCHHSASIHELETCFGNRGHLVLSCYRTFAALLRNPDDMEAIRRLDLVRTEFEEAASVFDEAFHEYYAKLELAKQQTKQAEERLAKAEQQLQDIKLSTSWQVTKPLRSVGMLMRRPSRSQAHPGE